MFIIVDRVSYHDRLQAEKSKSKEDMSDGTGKLGMPNFTCFASMNASKLSLIATENRSDD